MKNNRLLLIMGALISVALIVSIFVVYNYKNNQVNSASDEQPKSTETNKSTGQDSSTTEKTDTTPETPEKPEQQPDENGYLPNQTLPTEPTYIKGILLANKIYPLPSTFAPEENPEARQALNQMLEAAKQQGFDLVAFSGYRSFEYQTTLYNNYVNRDGQAAADRYSARPGYSEHQTGLAFDIGERGKEDLWLTEEFGETPAGQWLFAHAQEYGFILRFPQNKEEITGYMYESWHYRYVGKDIAKEIAKQSITLEEYLGVK
ncbi:D-alanyl-D-alanine carboxypeptidase family protein [Lysinibacillus sp. FSL R7-0073]|uniref:D-alanyl-D-alanine carboxypeptidase n=1 Tax=Lysinibacillus fusiformis TaxID=28031 RepID=A0A1E4R121_9BACI|nr:MULTISPECIES: D-alanyl-D-alanine carboxypeptidase family protein [Lysinibacillus]MED4889416.1 D-alanyl-D-alanine carboxypeptidase family protein [Lysinibacillus fusiformis]ODV54128.1 D-alanyl-D-alanine carboxypeptidase [Lysinibacillus fusiformis]WKT76130.1 D-alanyl-D-alanine carboxypeptidase family protein [Lysinibacillus fusiformis]WKT79769.1 D-alanyl-D-alanine carboxypeptidase family protein [Lysinibacillus fusiformis]